ncbi:hypothetical protein GGF49_005681 [Coemansia sp. RSA 1853]|nr:hypothetical protein GGF49_005681 [Coemansia sp. RSA 1853]
MGILLTNDYIISSEDMDITDSAGRAAYISFIVSLCYCTDYELGYDPTVVWNADKEYWVIKCPDSTAAKDGEMRVVDYYARKPIFEAERLFGRHTRGFAASLDPNLVNKPDTFIKDAWPYESSDLQHTSRNELDILRDIEEQIGKDMMDTLGVIRATNGADVMVAHLTILKKSGYLHRDISPNNIMVVDDGERVRGLLIDFDYAVKTGEVRITLAERTGTLPFMSISNLQNSKVQRSELDDWESLLYVVCWLGVHGVSHDEQVAYQQEIDAARKVDKYYSPPLIEWESGSFNNVARAKKNDLEDDESFNDCL